MYNIRSPIPRRRLWHAMSALLTGALLFFLPDASYGHDIEPVVNRGDFTYKLHIEGAPKQQERTLLALTEAEKQQDNPPPTLYLLQRRLDNDSATIKKALDAIGFYDSRVNAHIDTDEEPYKAIFTVETGEPYILKSARVVLDTRGKTQDVSLPDPDTLGLGIGGTMNYEAINNARATVRNRVYERNCLRSVRVRAHVRVDTTAKEAEAVYHVHPGYEAVFGGYTVDGLETIRQPYIDRKIPWKQGECYRPDKIENLQVRLLQTNLFSASEIKATEEPDEHGEFPVHIQLRERAQRTIKAGIGYSSQEGVDFKPAWEHRNFFGEGEKLTLESTLSTFLQSLKGKLERPDFLRLDQKLVLESEISHWETDAYSSMSLRTQAMVTRPLAKNLSGGLGVGYALKRVDDEGAGGGRETFSMLSFPAYVEHNTRNNPLDATKGHFLRFSMTPFVDTINSGQTFFKTQGTAMFYHQHQHIMLKPTWAFRATVGSVMGSSIGDLPADERFYSGGGGSVRGYAFQSLGTLTNNSPDGGRSLVEFSGELRLRVTDSIGIVPFLDAGNVYNESFPAFDGDLYFAAGLGLRYHTDFGPFRVDFATPLDRRSGTDDAFQFYISFGQAF